MAKYPFTKDGVQQFQRDIYALDDKALEREAVNAANDFTLWITNHFDLSATQVDNLNNSDKKFSLGLGWTVASGIIGRVPLSFDNTSSPSERKCKTTTTASVSTSYNNQTGATTYTGTVGVSISWP